jgi:hypothetical protein
LRKIVPIWTLIHKPLVSKQLDDFNGVVLALSKLSTIGLDPIYFLSVRQTQSLITRAGSKTPMSGPLQSCLILGCGVWSVVITLRVMTPVSLAVRQAKSYPGKFPCTCRIRIIK